MMLVLNAETLEVLSWSAAKIPKTKLAFGMHGSASVQAAFDLNVRRKEIHCSAEELELALSASGVVRMWHVHSGTITSINCLS